MTYPLPTEPLSGYVLYRLELYNWGTFHKRIWQVTPEGRTALLTGANGSGKSTLVDALLTLLVPNAKRDYNFASGGNRRERSAKSYVRGAHGRMREAGTGEGKVQYLRDEKEYTILMAVFHNQGGSPPMVSIAQVFIDGGENVTFVVAQHELTIQGDFANFDSIPALRKRLRANNVEVMDQFNQYSQSFRKLLHLRSDKALELFNRTVAIKEIGSLNTFIRDHMLERTDVDGQIRQLRDNYENLTKAHDAIVKAERQRDLLLPIKSSDEKMRAIDAQIEEAQHCETAVPLYIAMRRMELADEAKRTAELRQEEHRSNFARIDRERMDAETTRDQLKRELESDETGRALERLKEEAQRLNREKNNRRSKARQYEEAAADIGMPGYSTLDVFLTKRATAEERLPTFHHALSKNDEHRDQITTQLVPKEQDAQKIQDEINVLKQQRTLIPNDQVRLRKDIAQALGLKVEDLPFAGELLRVRPEETDWEGAIERLLRGFAINLIVSESYYRKLAAYINRTHLNTKLVYQRVDEKAQNTTSRPAARAISRKIDIKQETPFGDWLRTELTRKFDYLCCDTIEDFQHERRAITREGQIKHDEHRHEKDDRAPIDNRIEYRLGWDNRAKLDALQSRLSEVMDEIKHLTNERTRLKAIETSFRDQVRNFETFLHFTNFEEIDWQTLQTQYDANIAQQRELESQSDHRRVLQDRLNSIKEQIKELQELLYQVKDALTRIKDDIRHYGGYLSSSEAILTQHPFAEWQAENVIIEKQVGQLFSGKITLDTLGNIEDRLQKLFRNRTQTLQKQSTEVRNIIFNQIAEFRAQFRVETEAIGSGLGALDGLHELLDRIQRDDLPKYRARFKDLLDKKMIDNIAGFRADLERQIESYQEVIDHLNGALKQINYDRSTYIQLIVENTRHEEITQFRIELRDCTANTLGGDADAIEQSFLRIKRLIERFEKEPTWATRVTDVRFWLSFAAAELWRDDNSVKDYYTDSSGKSGGQKAKLAYTILASAVSYQYGLHELSSKDCFRFIVIDEAFSKVDDSNARYAMQLFDTLGLQLLIVTPLDKIPVVEPFVGAYHYVSIPPESKYSSVYNLTVEEFHKKRSAFVAEGGKSDADDYA